MNLWTRISLLWMTVLYLVALGALQEDSALSALTEQFWKWKLRQFPESATSEDFHEHDDMLESFNLQTFEYRRANCSRFLEVAEGIDGSRLGTTDRLTLRVLKDQLTTYTTGYRWKDYGNLNPLNFLEGMHRSIAWVEAANYENEADYETYFTRLRELPRQIDEMISLMQRAIRLGTTNHRVSVLKVPDQLEEFTEVDPQDSVFYKPLRDILDSSSISRHKRYELRKKGKEIIEEHVLKSFRRLRNFLTEEYLPNTRPHHGVWSLKAGLEYYRALLRWHLSLEVSPQHVHQVGLREVHRIKLEMERIMKSLGRNGDLTSFFRTLETQKRFYNHTEEQLLEAYRSIIFERIEPKLPSSFYNLTDIPRVKVSAMSKDGISAMYFQGAFIANTRRPHTRPTFTMLALALHEANPGHHFQVSLIQKLPIPKFRRYLWGGRKSCAPLSFPYYTAYVEGWGLYAEYMGEELGLFNDPYERFGRYIFEMFRACRLVIDTGIHAMRWTREEAIHYMLNHTMISRPQIEIEIDRYITWPGQACAYKIGELKIKQLRAMAEKALGDRFDIRAFHWEVIRQGFVPLGFVEESIEKWVTAQALASGSLPLQAAREKRPLTTLALWLTPFLMIRRL